MNLKTLRPAALAAVVALAACSGGSMGGGGGLPVAPQQQQPSFGAQQVLGTFNARYNCDVPVAPDEMRCMSMVRTDEGAESPAGYRGPDLRVAKLGGFGPTQLRAAYGISTASQSQGKGKVIAIVDAFGYPKAEAELKVYRSQLGLPPCTIANHCLKIVNENGQKSPLPKPPTVKQGDWDGEQALDLDMVSAICPNCHILLVQASSASYKHLFAAVATAGKLGADVISNSYGGGEVSADNKAFDQTGVVITASSGDFGAGAQQPCSYRHVVCVGGTSLRVNSSPRGFGEVVWNSGGTSSSTATSATGSGCSGKVAKPPWQTDSGCAMRSESDIAAVADPATGVNVYHGAWFVYGGTSASSPIVAAMVALAGNSKTIDLPKAIWDDAGKNTYDVQAGNNEGPGTFTCPVAMKYICYGAPGYDGPTGWGTPKGLAAL